MRSLDELLGEAASLASLPAAHRETMAGCAQLKVFEPGERLLMEGAPADEFFLIRRGTVAIETTVPGRGAVPLETLGAGDLVGWSWLVPPFLSAFHARAVDGWAVVFPESRETLRLLRERDYRLGLLSNTWWAAEWHNADLAVHGMKGEPKA